MKKIWNISLHLRTDMALKEATKLTKQYFYPRIFLKISCWFTTDLYISDEYQWFISMQICNMFFQIVLENLQP